jgi:hypothetical protein
MAFRESIIKDLENLMGLLNSTPTSAVFQSFPLQNVRIEEYSLGTGTHRMWFETDKEDEAEDIEAGEVLIVSSDIENDEEPRWFLFQGRRASNSRALVISPTLILTILNRSTSPCSCEA